MPIPHRVQHGPAPAKPVVPAAEDDGVGAESVGEGGAAHDARFDGDDERDSRQIWARGAAGGDVGGAQGVKGFEFGVAGGLVGVGGRGKGLGRPCVVVGRAHCQANACVVHTRAESNQNVVGRRGPAVFFLLTFRISFVRLDPVATTSPLAVSTSTQPTGTSWRRKAAWAWWEGGKERKRRWVARPVAAPDRPRRPW